MTASAPIAGNLRTIPDAAAAPAPDSGVPAHANFRSVLEQVHASRETAANTDDTPGAPPQKQKDLDPSTTLAIPQPVAPPAEAPRLILPFNTSLTLRQDTSASPGDTGALDATASKAASKDSTEAADPNTVPSAVATSSLIPAGFRGTLDLRSSPLESDTKTNAAPSGTQPKLLPKLQAKSKDSAPEQNVTAPPDSSVPVLPVTFSTTSQQATTSLAISSSSTVDEAPDTASFSTSTLDRGSSILTTSRNAAAQYRFSQESDSSTAAIKHSDPPQQEVSDPATPVTVPLPVTQTADPQPLLHPPAASVTPRQDASASQSSPTVTGDSAAASGTDPKTITPPALEWAEATTPAAPTGSLAFAARLAPTEATPVPTPDTGRTPDSQSQGQTALQFTAPATTKQLAAQLDLAADAHSGQSGSQPEKEKASDLFAKPVTVLPQTHPATPDQTFTLPTSHAPATPLSPAARMDQVQDPPAAAPTGNHDITIRIPDANTGQGTAVRFVERAGEVHVSVRTADADMAQTLRGSLNDLVNRLEDGGIRTLVWQPGADASTSHNDSHQPFPDPDGSSGRQFSSGSNSEQESQQQNRPRWVEELEDSIGNPNFKETTQLPWQA